MSVQSYVLLSLSIRPSEGSIRDKSGFAVVSSFVLGQDRGLNRSWMRVVLSAHPFQELDPVK